MPHNRSYAALAFCMLVCRPDCAACNRRNVSVLHVYNGYACAAELHVLVAVAGNAGNGGEVAAYEFAQRPRACAVQDLLDARYSGATGASLDERSYLGARAPAAAAFLCATSHVGFERSLALFDGVAGGAAQVYGVLQRFLFGCRGRYEAVFFYFHLVLRRKARWLCRGSVP